VTVVFALAGPFLVSLFAVSARRRFGVWAGWLVLFVCWFLYGRFLARNLWWSEPTFPLGLDDAVAAFVAALVMGLTLHSFPPRRPRLLLQVLIVGIAGLLVQWALSKPPVLPPAIDRTLKAYDGGPIAMALILWLAGLLARDVRRWRRARSGVRELEREA